MRMRMEIWMEEWAGQMQQGGGGGRSEGRRVKGQGAEDKTMVIMGGLFQRPIGVVWLIIGKDPSW